MPGCAAVYSGVVQMELPFFRVSRPPEPAIEFVRQKRARKYILRIRPDGTLRVTIPRGGSRTGAEAFVASHRQWAERERLKVAAQHAPLQWPHGHTILLRGAPVAIRIERGGTGHVLVLGDQREDVAPGTADLRSAAETALRHIARRELPVRLGELAAAHGLAVRRVTIRNQRTRWGSCSRSGVVALNFRLVQMPPDVCDYVILHELMHLQQQNHSRRFWRLVEDVCPGFREAERWLRREGRALF